MLLLANIGRVIENEELQERSVGRLNGEGDCVNFAMNKDIKFSPTRIVQI